MEKFTAPQLRAELQARNLSTKGKKHVLLKRLKAALDSETDVQNSPEDVQKMQTSKVSEQSEVRPEHSQQLPVQESYVSHLSGQQQDVNTRHLQDIVGPHDSASQVTSASHSSQSSRVESEIRKEDAKKAGLLAKVSLLEKQQQLEDSYLREQLERQMMENKYKQEKEKLKLEAEIAETEARREVLERYEMRSNVSRFNMPLIVESQSNLNVQADVFIPRQPVACVQTSKQTGDGGQHSTHYIPQLKSAGGQTINSTSKVTPTLACASQLDVGLMISLLSSNLKHSIPSSTYMEKFDGDVTRYHSFIKLFDSTISSKLTDDEEKLAYLERFTKGEANKVVRTCTTLPPDEGYKEARKLLKEYYGDLDAITHAYVDEITNWPNLKEGNVKEFREFRTQLKACHHALKGGILQAKDLDNPKTMKKIVNKLPYLMQDKWHTLAYDIKVNRKVELGDLVAFVERQESIMKHASIGDDSSSKKSTQSYERPKGNTEKKTTSSFPQKTKVYNTKVEEPEQQQVRCGYCEKEHSLAYCEVLRTKPFDERTKFVTDKGLCFSCLNKGHMARERKKRKACNTVYVKKKHPTAMHRKAEDMSNFSITIGMTIRRQ